MMNMNSHVRRRPEEGGMIAHPGELDLKRCFMQRGMVKINTVREARRCL